MKEELVESLVEEVLKVVTKSMSVSVCSLGNQWSVNLDGKLFHFVVVGNLIIEVCLPPGRDVIAVLGTENVYSEKNIRDNK